MLFAYFHRVMGQFELVKYKFIEYTFFLALK